LSHKQNPIIKDGEKQGIVKTSHGQISSKRWRYIYLKDIVDKYKRTLK